MSQHVSFETPTLLVDEYRCRNNIDRMMARASLAGCVLRPHFKTHQSKLIGTWFRDAGVDRIACSSFRMAAYFASAGWADITVAFPVNLREFGLINTLAERVKLTVLVESPEVITRLDKCISHDVKAMIKIDVGSHRTGINSHDRRLLEDCLIALRASVHLKWSGFLAHAGHTYSARGMDEIEMIHQKAVGTLAGLNEYIDGADEVAYISYGDTPSCSVATSSWNSIDEMRPGNYVFYDLMQHQIGSCDKNDIAVALVCPVVAIHPERDTIVIYGGAIHFARDHISSGAGLCFGELVELGDNTWQPTDGQCYIRALSQEHGVVHAPPSILNATRPGDVLGFVPVHSCMTAQCMAGYQAFDGRSIDHFASQC